MEKNNIAEYVKEFFNELQVSSDNGSSLQKEALEQSILAFLDNETKDTAFDVYRSFSVRTGSSWKVQKTRFLDLLDMLSIYEERAATLIDKQRDHYIHSVNVFILGLCIYSKNTRFRAAFKTAVFDEKKYPENYKNEREEFFFRWGLAALFHDVGYPVEIIGRQIEKFMKFATNADHDDTKGDIKAHLEFENFRRLNSIAEVVAQKRVHKRLLRKKRKQRIYRPVTAYRSIGAEDTYHPLEHL